MSMKARDLIEMPKAHTPTWSPDGRGIAYCSNESGRPQVWRADRQFKQKMKLTNLDRSITDIQYSPTTNSVLIHTESNGLEISKFHVLDVTTGKLQKFPLLNGIHYFGIWSRNGEWIIYKSNERAKKYFDIYRISLRDMHRELLVRNDSHNNLSSAASPDGRYFIYSRQTSPDSNEIYLHDLVTGSDELLSPVAEHSLFTSIQWGNDGNGLYLLTNWHREFKSVAFLDLHTKSMNWITSDTFDVESVRISPDGLKLAYIVNESGRSKLVVRNLATGVDKPIPSPVGVIGQLSWSSDCHALAMSVNSVTRGLDVSIIELNDLTDTLSSESIRTSKPISVVPTSVTYRSFDNLTIPAWLYTPAFQQESSKKLPCVIHIHGGPAMQSRPTFQPLIQFLVANGFCVLDPNIRGSTGYGKRYAHLDDGRARFNAIKDIIAARDFLKSVNYVDINHLALVGGSYGGFMALCCLAHFPRLWAAGVISSAMADLESFLERTSIHRRDFREREYGSLNTDREFLRAISPINHVQNIMAPLLIFHGINDVRVPVYESDRLVERMHALGKPVRYVRFKDEGHGLDSTENKVKTYSEIADFLNHYLRAD